MMEKLTKDDPETRSVDQIAENIEKLKELFPEIVTEGSDGPAVNVDVLKALVGDATVTDADEKYGLNWHGKRRARQLALTPSTGTLRPCPGESVDWDTTRNLVIEGDNLEVLKLLQKSYAGKVKLIYIDPPYNTGKDFVYPDNFRDGIQNYLEITGQLDGDSGKVSSNTDASGRFHTTWLNMMYPRLKLARHLLRDDGAIFVSCDDNEVHNLRLVLDEIFGDENFVATCIWQKRYSRENRGSIGDAHDYLIVYAASRDDFENSSNRIPMTEEQARVYKNPNGDPRGRWRAIPMTAQGFRPNQMYEIETPAGTKHTPPEGRCWSMTEPEYAKLKAEGRIYFGKDGTSQPGVVRYLSEVDGLVPWTWWPAKEVGHTDEARKEIRAIFGSQTVYDTPKPTRLLRRIIEIACSRDGLVLDFFAGSGTTAQAVYESNAEDNGRRRFILVQLPEPTGRDDFPTIAEITKERVRRTAERIKGGVSPVSVDLGFRSLKLDESNIRAWRVDRDDAERTLLDSVEHLRLGRDAADILCELLLKFGLDLCVPIETRTIAGKAVHGIGGGVLLACLAGQITRDEAEPLALGIATWHTALAPAAETICVFRDSAFADDVAKANLAAILNQHGLTNVRSL